jgi:hypothetical protein
MDNFCFLTVNDGRHFKHTVEPIVEMAFHDQEFIKCSARSFAVLHGYQMNRSPANGWPNGNLNHLIRVTSVIP